MARKPRFPVAGLPMHVIQRGNNRQVCFTDSSDRRRYLADLGESLHRYEVALHTWVLMSNHVHLLVTPKQAGTLSCMMQLLGNRYVRWFNRRHERSGTLWEGRFRASLVESDAYLLACMRYIELNPVRAGMAQTPDKYRWSSFAANALGIADPLVTPHPTFLALGQDARHRRSAYRELFSEPLGDAALSAIRDAANSELALGSERFKNRIEADTSRQAGSRIRGRPPAASRKMVL